MKNKITIIGAGISGLSAARFLTTANAEVELLEKANTVGGLVKCEYVADNLFHKVGGHVFNARNREIFDWFWSQFDQEAEFFRAKRNAKILLGGKLIGYPLENHLFQLGRETVKDVLEDLLRLEKGNRGSQPEYQNFEDFLMGNFGKTLYKLYFEPYNRKVWNTDLGRIPLGWLEGKLPMPDIRQILLSNMVREEESEMVHSTFFYPKSGGSQFIANRLAEGLPVRTNYEVKTIERRAGRLLINGTLDTAMLIYTGDVRKLADLLTISDSNLQEALRNVRDLKSTGTSNIFCECDANDLSWLYIPGAFTKAHRIIYTGNFSAANNRGTNRRTCVVEFSGKVAHEVMKEEIKSLPGNLSPLAFHYQPDSYVIQEKDTRQKINDLKKELEKHDIYLAGRFAEWEYYNMDKAIEVARDLVCRITGLVEAREYGASLARDGGNR
jgi:protoporphyrinogen oxidase